MRGAYLECPPLAYCAVQHNPVGAKIGMHAVAQIKAAHRYWWAVRRTNTVLRLIWNLPAVQGIIGTNIETQGPTYDQKSIASWRGSSRNRCYASGIG
jgi:hypothetical protein